MTSPGLTFDFFSYLLVCKAILVTAKCADSIITFADSTVKDTLLPKRSTWTQKILPQTDARLQQETMEILTPIYKEIGCCVMSDGWQSIDKLYSEPIDGLDESIRKKVHALFMLRWNTFHDPDMTVRRNWN